MALSSQTSRNKYIGTGSLATYSYTFKIFAQTDLVVTVEDTLGVETALTLTTDYTVTGVGVTAGGTITLVAGNLASGYGLTIRRVRPLTQQEDFRNQDDFFPENHENAFDNATMVDQQLQEQITRSVKLPASIDVANFDPTLPTNIGSTPGAPLVVNDTGTGLKVGSTSSSTDTTRVSKAGDTMTGDLQMNAQKGVKFGDADSSNFLTVKSAAIVAVDRTITLPDPGADDSVTYLAATQTLTNKTLTAPKISTISNTGTLTLPTSTDTLVGKATTDTLSNKTMSTLVTPATISSSSGTFNDVSTSGLSFITFTGASGGTFSGFGNPVDGKYLKVLNNSANQLFISHEGSGSTAVNRVTSPDARDIVLSTNQCAEFIYDSNATRWKLIGPSYEENTFTANFNAGAATTSNNVTIKYVRIGKQVTLHMPPLTFTAGANSNSCSTAASTLNARIIPTITVSIPCRLQANSIIQLNAGSFRINTDGSIDLQRTLDASTGWISGQTNNGNPVSSVITYTLL